ncbi:MAG: hypothetical protein RL291_1325, partial [Pseudomonadota bacterium]
MANSFKSLQSELEQMLEFPAERLLAPQAERAGSGIRFLSRPTLFLSIARTSRPVTHAFDHWVEFSATTSAQLPLFEWAAVY